MERRRREAEGKARRKGATATEIIAAQEKEVAKWMMNKRSAVNPRFGYGVAGARKSRPEWHDIADKAARQLIQGAAWPRRVQ